MEIEEEFISGFCRTMNGGETVCCEYTQREDGSRELTFMDCAHERCVNTGVCEISGRHMNWSRNKFQGGKKYETYSRCNG